MTETTTLTCGGCGWTAPDIQEQPFPFRCARRRAGDDIDHVLIRMLDPSGVPPAGTETNPFVRYRHRLHSYHIARSLGTTDDGYVELVQALDSAIAEVDGHGFGVTPWRRCARLSERLGFSGTGGVWVKDETGNVSGSHKARHLMGIMLYLEVVRRAGLYPIATADSARSHRGVDGASARPESTVPPSAARGPWSLAPDQQPLATDHWPLATDHWPLATVFRKHLPCLRLS